jgi:hypothetical protein
VYKTTGEAMMSDEEAAAFARSVLGWFAGVLDRAVLEALAVRVGMASPAAMARAELMETQRALADIERAFTGVIEGVTDAESLALFFCEQLVLGFGALFEWYRLEALGERH